MNTKKRNEYEAAMSLNGIDTVSGYIPTKISATDIKSDVKCNITQCNYKITKDKTYLLINPNKSENGEQLITKYSEFKEKMERIFESIGSNFNAYDMIRVDFCFNSTDKTTYGSYQKLHRLLISCLAKAYKYKNCYVSCDLWDFERLSIAIKKDDSEIENYNKERQSEGKDICANRLELRSKRMSGTSIEYQFVSKWFERLDHAKDCFDEMQMESNNHLEKLYKDDLSMDPKDRNYLSLTAFLLQYKEAIYTRRQMIDLLGRFAEVKNPVKRADRFKYKHKIEYFSKKDLEYIIRILKKKTIEYFNS